MTATLRGESTPLDEIVGGANTQEPTSSIQEIKEPLDENNQSMHFGMFSIQIQCEIGCDSFFKSL